MKKILLLLFALSFMTVEAQVQRGIEKSDIRRGTNVISSEETIKSVRKRPGKVKYGRMYISRISSQGEIPIITDRLVALIAKDANLTKVDAGNALNAFVANLSSMLSEKGDVIHVTVAENKALSITMSDTDADGDGVLDVRTMKNNTKDADGDGYGEY